MKILTILGFGNVGASIAFGLLNAVENLHVNIIDPNKQLEGKFIDLQHAFVLYPKLKLSVNNTEVFQNSDVIIHTAGVQNKASKSRLDVLDENIQLTKAIFTGVQLKSSAKIIVVSNPVDIISFYTWKYSNLEPRQIIGTGTFLDSNRLQSILINATRSSKSDVKAYVLGEHGDTQFAAYSLISLNAKPLPGNFSEDELKVWEEQTKNTAYEIRKTQESTHYGVAQCVIQLLVDLQQSHIKTYPLSVYTNTYYNNLLDLKKSIYISLMVEVSEKGVFIVDHISLNPRELKLYKASAHSIAANLK